ncbi:unnamed protein product [Victoria cruziana]
MPSTGVFGFLRKARRFWFSGEESLESEAPPGPAGISAGGEEHPQSGPATCHLVCLGKVRCRYQTDGKKLARVGSFGMQAKPGLLGGRNKVQALPADETVAAPRRCAGTQAAIGAIRLNRVAPTPHRKTSETCLWKRRTRADPPRLQFD